MFGCHAVGVLIIWFPLLLHQHLFFVEALNLVVHTWKASKGSILTAAIVQPLREHHQQPILVTGGHAGDGRISCWKLSNNSLEGNKKETVQEIQVGSGARIHDGSIFSMASCISTHQNINYLVSGSFDRSAAIHRVDVGTSSHAVTVQTIGRLPEHTGWVRHVEAVEEKSLSPEADDERTAGTSISLLSIGCNLINTWSVLEDGEVARVARLDAGPSPNDPPEETFRRHDILTFAILGDNDGNSKAKWIAAGLVDGSIRVFVAEFEKWMRRRQNSPYDATGSCDCPTTTTTTATSIAFDHQDEQDMVEHVLEDEKPFLSTNCHAGRITKIHCIQGFPDDFVSTSFDGTWVRWRIDAEMKSLSKLVEGSISKAGEQKNEGRICSSTIVTENTCNDRQNNMVIYLGTSSGCLYRSWLSRGGESEKIHGNGKDASITAMTPWRHKSVELLVACRSDGTAMLFR